MDTVGPRAQATYICFKNCPSPPWLISFENIAWARTAPNFPQAADTPWAVERYRVGKTSPGYTKVVVFGPKFWKKLAKQ